MQGTFQSKIAIFFRTEQAWELPKVPGEYIGWENAEVQGGESDQAGAYNSHAG